MQKDVLMEFVLKKTLKCNTKRKCSLIKRKFYKKCFAWGKRKLHKGKGHCNVRSCCKFLKVCQNGKCKSTKMGCKVHKGKCAKFFGRCSSWKMQKVSAKKLCRVQLCCQHKKTCFNGHCSVAKLSCKRNRKCQIINVKVIRKCGKMMKKISTKRICNIQKCCRHRKSCVDGKCSKVKLGCKTKRSCKKRCQVKVHRTRKCRQVGVVSKKNMKCPVTQCCIHVKKCCGRRKCSTKREQCTRITKCHGTFSKCGAFKTKRTKNSICSVRKCCKFYRSCVGSKCNNKKLLCQDHKKCKTVCHKKNR